MDDDDQWNDGDELPKNVPALSSTSDYYHILNVPRDVQDEELRAAYKRLCVLFHPDKHTQAGDKEAAERNFRAVNEAYEVISDPNKRSLYDMYGIEGLRAGWEVGPRLKSTQEIREEYERKKRQREEDEMRRQVTSKGSLQINVDASSVLDPEQKAIRQSNDSRRTTLSGFRSAVAARQPEIGRLGISQTIQFAVASGQVVTLNASIFTRNGIGGGLSSIVYSNSTITGQMYEITVSTDATGPVSSTFKHQRNLAYGVVGVAQIGISASESPVSYAVSLFRSLSNTTNGFVQFQAEGPANAMIVGSTYTSDKWFVRPTLQLGMRAYALEINAAYKLDSDTKLRLSAGLVGIAPSFGLGVERVLSYHVRATAMFEYNVLNGVFLKLRLSMVKIGHAIVVPIFIAPILSLSSVAVGLVLPAVCGYALRKFVLDPRKRRAKQKELDRLQREYADHTAQKRREAEEAVRLMHEYVQRKVDTETNRNGLIILEAQYGRLDPVEFDDEKPIDQDEPPPSVVNVTAALQSLVHNSQLHLHAGSKASLIGFYDPCMGEHKKLRIVYFFKRRLHEVIVSDEEPVSLPLRSHAIKTGPAES